MNAYPCVWVLLFLWVPAAPDADAPPPIGGTTYVAPGTRREVLAYARDGGLLWRINSPAPDPIGIEVTRGGKIFFGAKGSVHQVSPRGRILRSIRVKHPKIKFVTSLQALPRGEFLVVDFNTGVVAQIDGKGSTIWEPKGGPYYDARRLRSGNTVVVGPAAKLVELDPGGNVVRSLPLSSGAVSVSPLDNGHFLVAKAAVNNIVEVDARGKTVWTFDTKNPYYAQRLMNGNTLVTARNPGCVMEVTREGKVVWRIEVAKPRAGVRSR